MDRWRNVFDQPVTVEGKITDQDSGRPVEYATVRSVLYKRVALSDSIGRYSVKALHGDTLFFSMIGYGESRQPVEGRRKIDIKRDAM